MATVNAITEILTFIKSVYSGFGGGVPFDVLVNVWKNLLEEFPDEAVKKATAKCLQESRFEPKPADIISIIREAQRSQEPTGEELWSICCEHMRKANYYIHQFHYTYIDGADGNLSQGEQARKKARAVWDSLPEKIRMYFASENEFLRRSRELEFSDYERDRFLRAMPIMEKRQEFKGMMLESPEFRLMIE